MNDESIDPGDGFIHPRVIDNPPGRSSIAYRTGDFASFREALLRGLPGEQQLRGFRPSADGGDLALQMLEWWAYLADILTFYNERIAGDSYLRTAAGADAIARIVSLVGYRARPALGATGKVAALSTARVPIQIPAGLGIQSKPSPGKPPMTVEVDQLVSIEPGGALPVELAVDTELAPWNVLIKGVVSGVKPGDGLVVVMKSWSGSGSGSTTGYTWMTVQSLAQEKDPSGKPNTRIRFKGGTAKPGTQNSQQSSQIPQGAQNDTQSSQNPDTPPLENAYVPPKIPDGTLARDCRLLRSARQTPVRQSAQHAGNVVALSGGRTVVHLSSLAHDIKPGDWVLMVSQSRRHLFVVNEAPDATWNEGASSPFDPATGTAFPVPLTALRCQPQLVADFPSAQLPSARVYHGLTDVGEIIDEPATTITGSTLPFVPAAPLPSSLVADVEVILEDATGRGCLARVASASSDKITVTRTDTATLTAPVRILHNIVPVSQGTTVPREVLGDGDATAAGQSFVLQKWPVTYFGGGAPDSSLPYRSSVRVLVSGVPWVEVDSFIDQPPRARVFISREDADGKTHVIFGDGVNGARLPTGKGNVVAAYRHGAGGGNPDPGSLTSLLQSVAGLSAVRSPVSPGGAEEAEPGEQMQRYAPRSMFTFGRAISLDDYEAIAVVAGARRARAYYAFDADQQRALVKVYVGDDKDAVDLARAAIAREVDADVPFLVVPVTPHYAALSLTLRLVPGYDAAAVRAEVQRAVLDPEGALFGAGAQVGEALYDSQIAEVCLRVAGVLEVVNLTFQASPPSGPPPAERHPPGEGSIFLLSAQSLDVTMAGGGNGK